MTQSQTLSVHVDPKQVHETLGRHILVDGFHIVLDLEASRGAYLRDAREGRTYLDMFGMFASQPVGMNHPGVTDPAFVAKMGRVAIHNPTNSDVYTVEMAEFVETFARFAGQPELPHLFFVAGGGLGVENAMKTAMDWKVRKNQAKGLPRETGHKVVHFKDAFHGRTGYTLSCTNTADPRKNMYFAKLDWPRISNPKVTFPLTGENLARAQEAEAKALAEIDAAFDREGDDICAIIIETIQGEGGDNHFRPEFHQALRRVADERDAMLIYDEVQTGFGLTGKLWAFEHYGMRPDMIAFGKKTQVCGCMVSRRVDEVERNVFVESSRLNSTWGGNLADMVRSTRYMQIIQEERLVENAAKVGQTLLRGLHDLRRRFPEHVLNPRGLGLFCAFDLPTAEARGTFLGHCRDNGMLILGCGTTAVRFRPTMDVTDKEIGAALDIVERSIVQTRG